MLLKKYYNYKYALFSNIVTKSILMKYFHLILHFKNSMTLTKNTIHSPVCAIDYAFQCIGGKYKARILWYIYQANNLLRYGQLNKMLQNITSKMLTQCLRQLESDNLIHRKVYQEVPPKVEYSLSKLGLELIPVLSELRNWGEMQMKK